MTADIFTSDHMVGMVMAVIVSVPVWIGILYINKAMHDLHLEINSRMTELLTLTKKAAHEEGVQEERFRVEKN